MDEHEPQDGQEYVPTPEQIREACRQIQAEWTPAQEAHRRLWNPSAYRTREDFSEPEALERVTSWFPPGVKRHAS